MHVKNFKDFGGNAKVCYEAMYSLLCLKTNLALKTLYGEKGHLIKKELRTLGRLVGRGLLHSIKNCIPLP
jgi:hypothetical protein